MAGSEGGRLLSLCSEERAESPAKPIDWGRLLALAGRHGLIPLLAQRLDELDDRPAWVEAVVRRRASSIASNNLARTAELLRLVDLFDSNAIDAVTFKGPTLALQAYGDLASRQFADLDILVDRSGVAESVARLADAGYVMKHPLHPSVFRHVVRHGHELSLSRSGGSPVELQWGLAATYFVVDADIPGMLSRRIHLPIGGRLVPVLSPEDNVVALSIHASKHLWERVAWAVDLDRFVRTTPGLDWDLIRARAIRARATRMLRLAIAIAWRGLAAPWATSLSVAVGNDPAADHLAARIVNGWFNDAERAAHDPTSSLERDLFRVHDSRRDAVSHLLKLIATPSVDDLEAVRLPGHLRWLYPSVRVARFVGGRTGR